MKILSCNYQPHALGRQTSERGAFLVVVFISEFTVFLKISLDNIKIFN